MTQGGLLDQILSGTNRNLQVLAASGLVPLPPEDLIPIQVALTTSPDNEIVGKAMQALQGIDASVGAAYVSHQAGPQELAFFGLNVDDPKILEAVVRRTDVPRQLLMQMAPTVAEAIQEILVLRQDAILEEPEILFALERNPALSSYTKRRIWEYREHLLPRDKVPPKSAEEIAAEADALTEEDIQEAIEEVRDQPADGPVDDNTGLSAAQIKLLPVPARVKMARNADRQIRSILIRDANTQVAMAVMTSNSLPDSEVEMIASSRNVVPEVLAEIPKRREWIRKYSIAKALVKNPKTNLAISMKLIPRMSVRDLRELARDKNVPDGVRTTSLRLYQARR